MRICAACSAGNCRSAAAADDTVVLRKRLLRINWLISSCRAIAARAASTGARTSESDAGNRNHRRVPRIDGGRVSGRADRASLAKRRVADADRRGNLAAPAEGAAARRNHLRLHHPRHHRDAAQARCAVSATADACRFASRHQVGDGPRLRRARLNLCGVENFTFGNRHQDVICGRD